MTKPYYDEGGITIYHGDCREVLLELDRESVDLVLTDPPYGMAYSSFGKSAAEVNISADGVRQGARIVRQALFETAPLLRADAHLLMFCHFHSYPDYYDAVAPYLRLRNALIWNKGGGGSGSIKTDYIRDYEIVLYGARGAREIAGDGFSAVLSGFSKPQQRWHPTQKPVSLLRHLIERHCPPTGRVLDPFVGAGSTLLAARDSGRRAIGIEIEERYCEIAVERLAQEVLDVAA